MPITYKHRYLLDTNVILRYADQSHALYPMAKRAIDTLKQSGHDLYIAPQNYIESSDFARYISIGIDAIDPLAV